jgi:hypothetical protein
MGISVSGWASAREDKKNAKAQIKNNLIAIDLKKRVLSQRRN